MTATSGYHAEFPGEPASIRAARRACLAWVAEATSDPDLMDSASLVVSELVANAVEAAPGSTLIVGASWIDGELSLGVRSATSIDMLPPEPWDAPGEGAPRGRGLAIVRALASDVRVVDHGSALTVSVRLAPGTADAGSPTGSF